MSLEKFKSSSFCASSSCFNPKVLGSPTDVGKGFARVLIEESAADLLDAKFILGILLENEGIGKVSGAINRDVFNILHKPLVKVCISFE